MNTFWSSACSQLLRISLGLLQWIPPDHRLQLSTSQIFAWIAPVNTPWLSPTRCFFLYCAETIAFMGECLPIYHFNYILMFFVSDFYTQPRFRTTYNVTFGPPHHILHDGQYYTSTDQSPLPSPIPSPNELHGSGISIHKIYRHLLHRCWSPQIFLLWSQALASFPAKPGRHFLNEGPLKMRRLRRTKMQKNLPQHNLRFCLPSRYHSDSDDSDHLDCSGSNDRWYHWYHSPFIASVLSDGNDVDIKI